MVRVRNGETGNSATPPKTHGHFVFAITRSILRVSTSNRNMLDTRSTLYGSTTYSLTRGRSAKKTAVEKSGPEVEISPHIRDTPLW